MLASIFTVLTSLLATAHAQVENSCSTPIYAVQQDEVYLDESKVHSGNLKEATIVRNSLREFDEVSEISSPAFIGVPDADIDSSVEARLLTFKSGKPFQGVTRKLTLQSGDPVTSEYEGKKITYRIFETGSTLLSLFHESISPKGEYKVELFVTRAGKSCSVLVPLRPE